MPVGYSSISLMVAIFARLAVSITQTTPFSATPETVQAVVLLIEDHFARMDNRFRGRSPR
ncbi:Uncharacterised protein [Raoultella terrigena]|uniref:Uncharacterized protein n=1 Tax=Raoultella terrigena TaxID=577 RepID=A0A4U9D7M8_RAOTE|nr:Uncharacterised protein [Raoultella terrigena]